METSASEQGGGDREEETEQQEEDLTRLLPADALAEVLRHLPRRGLAGRLPADDDGPEIPVGLGHLPGRPAGAGRTTTDYRTAAASTTATACSCSTTPWSTPPPGSGQDLSERESDGMMKPSRTG